MKLTIITPSLNNEQTIERAINSVINQDVENLEYIIVDGKSQDNTIPIIEKYARKYSFIKFISEKDNSMTEALNKGLRITTGDVIGIINADDEYFPNVFKFIIRSFENYNLDVLVGNSYHIGEETKKLKYISKPKYFSNYFLMCILDCFTPECSVFYSKSCINNVGFYNEELKFTQDYNLYLKILKGQFKIKYFDVNIGKFYMSTKQHSFINNKLMAIEAMSYVDYKWIHYILKKTKLNAFIRTLIGLRKYNNIFDFFNHVFGG